jgi:hypothetical protein
LKLSKTEELPSLLGLFILEGELGLLGLDFFLLLVFWLAKGGKRADRSWADCFFAWDMSIRDKPWPILN